MQIRRASIQDSAGIARVQVDSYRTAYAGILPQAYLAHFTYEEQEQDWRELLSSRPQDIVYVAEESGEIVGYALGRAGPSEIAPYDSELLALHIHRPHQHKGSGRRLVTAIAEQLRQQGCSSLMLWVLAANPARSFYGRLGGKLVGERRINLGGDVTAVEVAYGWPDIQSLCAATQHPATR